MSSQPEKLKGLSIRQPWAEMIKTVEYRSLPTKLRGKIYIYASLGKTDLDPADRADIELELDKPIASLPSGVVVGTVEITDCNGSDGECEWQLENPERFSSPLRPIEQPQPVWFHPFGRPQQPG